LTILNQKVSITDLQHGGGALLETWVVAEALKWRAVRGNSLPTYFWRDNIGWISGVIIMDATQQGEHHPNYTPATLPVLRARRRYHLRRLRQRRTARLLVQLRLPAHREYRDAPDICTRGAGARFGRGVGHSVLAQVNEGNRYRFDQACRVKAIKSAAALNMQGMLSINFMPNAIYQPERCIRTTLAAAHAHGFPIRRIIFETVEGELIEDAKWLAEVLRAYKAIGFLTAIDDFGAGFAGLNLLADFQPDIIKLDMALVRGVDASRPRQAIVRAVARMGEELGISILAEGVETVDEFSALQAMGIHLMQGYLFCKPRFEACAAPVDIAWPQVRAAAPEAR